MKRFWAKVDKTGECWLWTGATVPLGYGYFWLDGAMIRAHRVAYQWLVGPIPEGLELDHICHVRACVNPDHLRVVTRKQNCENRQGAQSNSGTGVRGVYWETGDSCWRAEVRHNGQRHRKRFTDFDEACDWVIAKRLELFTHNAADRVA